MRKEFDNEKKELKVIGIKSVAALTNYSVASIRWKVDRAKKGHYDFFLPMDGKKGEKLQFLKSAVEDWILRRHEKSNPNNSNVGTQQIAPETAQRLAKHGLAPK